MGFGNACERLLPVGCLVIASADRLAEASSQYSGQPISSDLLWNAM
jgi:hypothetical protein